MNIKILVFLAFTGLITCQAVAQKKCKFEYEKEDPFSGEILKGTKSAVYAITPASSEFWYIGINRINDVFKIANSIQMDGKMTLSLNKGDSIIFKTEDGSIISCYATELTNPIPTSAKVWDQSILCTTYDSKYNISKEQLETFTHSLITHVRINISDEVFQAEVKSKYAKDFMNDAKCILE
jgi:hypothetical protein